MQIIKGVKARARRILLYGTAGCGKTTWGASAPGAFIVNLEDGCDDIDCDRSPLIKNFHEFVMCLNWLQTNDHPYKTVVVDTVDWLEGLINRELCQASGAESLAEVAGGFGKGQARAVSKWDIVIQMLSDLHKKRGLGIILLSHSKIETVKPAEGDAYDKYAPSLAPAASHSLMEWVDEVLFAQFKVYVANVDEGFGKTRGRATGGKEVSIRTGETPFAYAKNRVSGMPAELPMNWDAYYQCVKSHYSKIDKGDIEAIVVDGSSLKGEQLKEVIAIEEEARKVF